MNFANCVASLIEKVGEYVLLTPVLKISCQLAPTAGTATIRTTPGVALNRLQASDSHSLRIVFDDAGLEFSVNLKSDKSSVVLQLSISITKC